MAYKTTHSFPLHPVDAAPFTIEAPGVRPVPGESIPRRHPKARHGLLERPHPDVDTVFALISHTVHKHRDEPAIGSRQFVKIHKELKKVTKIVDGESRQVDKEWSFFELSNPTYKTFGEYFLWFSQLGAGLRRLGLSRGDKLHIFASTSAQWLAMSHACASQALTIVTAYDTLGEFGVQHSLTQSGAVAIFTDPHLLKTVNRPLKLANTVRYVIYNDASNQPIPKAEINAFRAEHPNLQVLSIEELRAMGDHDGEPALPPDSPAADDLFCIMYTSGSTGLPKGVPVSHAAFVSAMAGLYSVFEECISHQDSILAYLPLAHILELVLENLALFVGGTLGYGSSRTLTDSSMSKGCPGDLRAFRPSILVGVPQVWETVRKGVTSGVDNAGMVAKALFSTHLAIKGWLVKTGLLQGPVASVVSAMDSVVFARVRATTGGNLRFVVNGASGIAADTQQFLSLVVAPMCNGYGLTETCGSGGIGSPLQFTGQAGFTIPASVEVKLVSQPDLGYDANPAPDSGKDAFGEILLRGKPVLTEYYQNPEETAQALTADGWFRTGDIGAFDRKTGHLRVVDRLKNLVKLRGGEYIALEKLDAIYRGAASVQNIMVYGDSEHDRPVAVVCVNDRALQTLVDKHGIAVDAADGELHHNPKIHAVVLKEILGVGKTAGLSPLETLQGIAIVNDEWTPVNGLVTATQKINRRPLREHYAEEIKKAYGDK